MKSVCIVGAGPAGLAGAKALLQTGEFRVTVYEKNSRIGGIWAVDEESFSGFLSPFTPTNISRYTVGFSDLDWNAVDLQSHQTNGEAADDSFVKAHVPMFPLAWQVNRYLEEFRRRYVPENVIELGCVVTKAERIVENGNSKWRISVHRGSLPDTSVEFDYLIIAAGFFSSPRPLQNGAAMDMSTQSPPAVKTIHTSQFRSLSELLPEQQGARGRKILVFGGGNSSGETAAAVAMQLSDAMHSPSTDSKQQYQDVEIVHVTPRPLYAAPPYLPVDEHSRAFLPLDMQFYDLSKRAEGPIVSNAGLVSRGVKDVLHTAVQSLIGGNQSDLGSDALTVPCGEPRSPVYVTLSETYPEFVRSGLIKALPGRVKAIWGTSDNTAQATVEHKGVEVQADDIAAIIYATGYTGSTAVEFLDEAVKSKLQFEPDSPRLPLILSGYQTHSPDIPDLAFLGFYESPYWTMIELQADLTATRWLKNKPIPSRPYEAPATLLLLREAMHARGLDVPQYWFSDHAAFMEEAAAHLQRTRSEGAFGAREGPVLSARYRSPYTNTAHADAIMADVHATWQACINDGRYVARAAFRALQGNWTIHRNIVSALPSFPSGTLTGTASFFPRRPTLDKSGKRFELEYLYVEAGSLVLSNGATMPATRRYVYRYSEARDELSVWFVKPERDREVDYLFHNLAFALPAEAEKAGACIAKADHLCVDDMYWTEYRLPLKGISLHEFSTSHTVRGPSKDYVTTTEYRRPEIAKGVVR